MGTCWWDAALITARVVSVTMTLLQLSRADIEQRQDEDVVMQSHIDARVPWRVGTDSNVKLSN